MFNFILNTHAFFTANMNISKIICILDSFTIKKNSGLLLSCDRLVSQYNVNVKRFILERKRNPNYFIVNKQIHPSVLLHWNFKIRLY